MTFRIIIMCFCTMLTLNACFQGSEVGKSGGGGDSIVNIAEKHQAIEKPRYLQSGLEKKSDTSAAKESAHNSKQKKLDTVSVIADDSSNSIEFFDSEIDIDSLVEVVSAYHYKQPEESEVRLHIKTLTDFKSYLHTLDAYSNHISHEKVAYSRVRNTLPRIGIGLDVIEHKGKLLAIPITKGALYRAGFITPQYLKSIQGKVVNYNDFSSYKLLADMKMSNTYSIGLVQNGFSDNKEFKVDSELTRRKLHYNYQDKHTAVLGIKEFSLDVRKYLTTFFKKNIKIDHLVIDLRYCIGGNPGFAVDVLGFFIGQQKKVVTFHSVVEDKVYETVSAPYEVKKSSKITILISEFTASSAELFVHALKHYRPNLTLVGKPSAGKCLAQKPYLLEDDSAIKLSVYELIMADGSRCEGKPIQVDKFIEDVELIPLSKVLQQI